MTRARAWDALRDLAATHGWDARVTFACNAEWASWALRARRPNGDRVVALWRGRDEPSARFTSACCWTELSKRADGLGYLTPLSARELREHLRAPMSETTDTGTGTGQPNGSVRMAHGAAT